MKYLESHKTFAKKFSAKKFAHKWNSETPVEILLPNYLDEEQEKERMQKEWEEANEEEE
jgi:hypothetical protein